MEKSSLCMLDEIEHVNDVGTKMCACIVPGEEGLRRKRKIHSCSIRLGILLCCQLVV